MTDPTTSGGPAGLADRVNQIHVPEPNADREARMLLIGAVLVGVGFVAALVGYFGASGTTNVYEQVPYALSGGVLGLGLIIVGSALITRFSLARLFRFWLARVVYEHQVQTDRTVEALGRIEAALTGGAASASATHSAPASAPASAHSAPAPAAAPDLDLAKPDAAPDGHRVRSQPLRAEPLDG